MRAALALLAVVAAALAPLSPNADDLAALRALVGDLRPGQWLEVPHSRIPLIADDMLTALDARHRGPALRGRRGPRGVVRSGNGAAFDGRRWFFWGGGGTAYGGNEWYVFDLHSLNWQRATDPAPLTGENRAQEDRKLCPAPALGRASARTHDGVLWNPLSSSVWVFADGGFCADGHYRDDDRAWSFDPDRLEWAIHDLNIGGLGRAKTAWNPRTRAMVVAAGPPTEGIIAEIDHQGRILRRQTQKQLGRTHGTMAYDERRHRMVVLFYGGRESGLAAVDLDDGEFGRWTFLTAVPDALETADGLKGGLAFHPPSGRFVLWPGSREVWAWDPDTSAFERFLDENSAGPTSVHAAGVFSKWIYVPEVDIFAGYNNDSEGVWLYRLPSVPGERVDQDAPAACLVDGGKETCFGRVAAAVAAARDGSTVVIREGRWGGGAVLHADGVTIRGEPNAAIHTLAARGQAAIVVLGSDATIEDLECYGITVADGNGACVKMHGRNLTLRRVHFRDSEQGLLGGGGRVVIEDSRFERLGHRGFAHAIYVTRGDELVLRRSTILAAQDGAHEVKSRTARSIIEDNVIASLDGRDSRLIDLPNGGEILIRNNVLGEGPFSQNADVIAIGMERGRRGEKDHAMNSAVIEGNTVVIDRIGGARFLRTRDVPEPLVRANTFVGGAPVAKDANRWFSDRAAADLPPYPALPQVPDR